MLAVHRSFTIDTAGAVGTSGLGRHGWPQLPPDPAAHRPTHHAQADLQAGSSQCSLSSHHRNTSRCWPTRRRDQLEGGDIHLESMHPGWGGNAGCRSLPADVSQDHPPTMSLRSTTAPIPRSGWSASRPDRPAFSHDRAQRPTTFGWQRAEDPAKVAHVLKQVSAMTGTPNEWVVGFGTGLIAGCTAHRKTANPIDILRCRHPVAWSRSTNSAFLPCGRWPLRVEPHGGVLPPAWRDGSRHRVDGGGIIRLYSWKKRVIVAV